LSNMTPPTDPRATKYLTAGGVNPDTLALIRKRAQDALANGTDVPTISRTLPKAGTGSNLLNALSYAGTGLDAYKKYTGGAI
jgi:hypothetical protein